MLLLIGLTKDIEKE